MTIAADRAEPLLERLRLAGLLTATDMTTAAARLTVRARYTIAIVHVGGAPRFVVKTARAADVAPLLAHERHMLQRVASGAAREVAPDVIDAPGCDDVLVVRYLRDAVSPPGKDAALATRLARRLALLHATTVRGDAPDQPSRRTPTTDVVGGTAAEAMVAASVVPTLLLPRLEELASCHPATAASLHFLAVQWLPLVLIHGDVKWEHVRADGALVDWELGGLGDPAWDVAALLHELCMIDAPGEALGRTLAVYGETLGRTLGHRFLTRCRAALSVRFVQSAQEYRAGGAGADVTARADHLARWWAEHPAALAQCVREAA